MAGDTVCWGLNRHGQLGVDGVESHCPERPDLPCTLEPREVRGAPPFTALAVGTGFSCALGADGRAWCWGLNGEGQLGDGTAEDRTRSAPVLGEHSFSRLVAANSHACGLDAGGRLFCWGPDHAGFGANDSSVQVHEPTPGAPGLAFTSIAPGFSHGCGVADTGVTWCWGSATVAGVLGNAQSRWRSRPPQRLHRVRVVLR